MPAVVLVLDPGYGTRIAALKQTNPLWVIDSPRSRMAWDAVDSAYANSAIFSPGSTAEETPDTALGDIEDHFGPYSSDNPYQQILVVGMPFSEPLKSQLRLHGFSDIKPSSDGVEARFVRSGRS